MKKNLHVADIGHDPEEWTNGKLREVESIVSEMKNTLRQHEELQGNNLGELLGERPRDRAKLDRCIKYVEALHGKAQKLSVSTPYYDNSRVHPANYWILYTTMGCVAFTGFIILIVILCVIF